MPEEPCQCSDCQRFYREHDRLIREFPTLRQQQELSWAALQTFRTLCGKVLEDLQKQVNRPKLDDISEKSDGGVCENRHETIDQVIADLENINAHLFSIEALLERIFDVKVPEEIETQFREVIKLNPLVE